MSGIARVGDIGVGVCYWHKDPVPYTTVFITGAPTTMSNDIANAIIGTVGSASCGHGTVAISGSPDVTFEGIGAHRIGDMGQNGGPYTVVSGSPDVISN